MSYTKHCISRRLIFDPDIIRSESVRRTFIKPPLGAIMGTMSSWSCLSDWPMHLLLFSHAWIIYSGSSCGSSYWYFSMISWYIVGPKRITWCTWWRLWALWRSTHYMPRNVSVNLVWKRFSTWGTWLGRMGYRCTRKISGRSLSGQLLGMWQN